MSGAVSMPVLYPAHAAARLLLLLLTTHECSVHGINGFQVFLPRARPTTNLLDVVLGGQNPSGLYPQTSQGSKLGRVLQRIMTPSPIREYPAASIAMTPLEIPQYLERQYQNKYIRQEPEYLSRYMPLVFPKNRASVLPRKNRGFTQIMNEYPMSMFKPLTPYRTFLRNRLLLPFGKNRMMDGYKSVGTAREQTCSDSSPTFQGSELLEAAIGGVTDNSLDIFGSEGTTIINGIGPNGNLEESILIHQHPHTIHEDAIINTQENTQNMVNEIANIVDDMSVPFSNVAPVEVQGIAQDIVKDIVQDIAEDIVENIEENAVVSQPGESNYDAITNSITGCLAYNDDGSSVNLPLPLCKAFTTLVSAVGKKDCGEVQETPEEDYPYYTPEEWTITPALKAKLLSLLSDNIQSPPVEEIFEIDDPRILSAITSDGIIQLVPEDIYTSQINYNPEGSMVEIFPDIIPIDSINEIGYIPQNVISTIPDVPQLIPIEDIVIARDITPASLPISPVIQEVVQEIPVQATPMYTQLVPDVFNAISVQEVSSVHYPEEEDFPLENSREGDMSQNDLYGVTAEDDDYTDFVITPDFLLQGHSFEIPKEILSPMYNIQFPQDPSNIPLINAWIAREAEKNREQQKKYFEEEWLGPLLKVPHQFPDDLTGYPIQIIPPNEVSLVEIQTPELPQYINQQDSPNEKLVPVSNIAVDSQVPPISNEVVLVTEDVTPEEEFNFQHSEEIPPEPVLGEDSSEDSDDLISGEKDSELINSIPININIGSSEDSAEEDTEAVNIGPEIPLIEPYNSAISSDGGSLEIDTSAGTNSEELEIISNYPEEIKNINSDNTKTTEFGPPPTGPAMFRDIRPTVKRRRVRRTPMTLSRQIARLLRPRTTKLVSTIPNNYYVLQPPQPISTPLIRTTKPMIKYKNKRKFYGFPSHNYNNWK